MAGLLLGAAGAAIGGPIGYLIGSTLGNLLFPQKGPDGPTLSNLHIQGSSYGTFLDRCYGTNRKAGQVIEQTDLTPHEHSSGGKGGPSQGNTTSYTASFAIALNDGEIVDVIRMWRDAELWYSTVRGEETGFDIPVKFYLGSHSQEPDPTLEAIHGVGNVPAYRGTAYAMFTDLDVTADGNRVPNIEFEVVEHGGYLPWRVNTFTPVKDRQYNCVSCAEYDFDADRLLVGKYDSGATQSSYTLNILDLDGNVLEDPIVVAFDNFNGGTAGILFTQCSNDSKITYAALNEAAPDPFVSAWYRAGVFIGGPVIPPIYDGITSVSNDNYYAVRTPPFATEHYLYACGGLLLAYIGRWDLVDGIPSTTAGKFYRFLGDGGRGVAGSDYFVTVDVDGDQSVWVWSFQASGTLAQGTEIYKFDPDLNLIHKWTIADTTAAGLGTGVYAPSVSRGVFCGEDTEGNTTLPQSNPAHRSGTGLAAAAWTFGADFSIEYLGDIDQTGSGPIVSLGRGLCLTNTGVISLNPPAEATTLAEIVEAESLLVGLADAEIDVTELTDVVDGYMITSLGTGRDAIDVLRPAYYFDAAEVDGVIKFKKRGDPPVATVPDADLSAYEESSDPPGAISIVRAMDIELPQLVTVSYRNVDADYQTGTQLQQRTSIDSNVTVSLQLPIVMDDAKGREVAGVNLFEPWIQREQFTLSLTRKWIKLDPTDVIQVGTRALEIQQKTDGTNGVLELKGVVSRAEIYMQTSVAGAATGFTRPTPTPGTGTDSTVHLLDIPLIDDGDPVGFYAAASRSCGLYKSSDGGASYDLVANLSASTLGTSLSSLGNWTEGNMFDECNYVDVLLSTGTLAGATELGVLNGANMAVVGTEVIQFKNADLVATDTYRLSGLLRGRRGTEHAIPTHVVGDRFVMLPVTSIAAPVSDINQTRLFKGVASGQALTSVNAFGFVNSGIAWRPYSPVLVGGGPIGNDVQINWTRRTRIGGAWLDGVDASLGEASEAYVVQIWDANYSSCARVISGLTSPTCTYTSAQQTTDFGALQSIIYCTVGQLGQAGLGFQARAAIPGPGVGTNAPLSPTQPFGYIPPAPPTGGGCTGVVTNATIDWDGAQPNRVINLGFAPGTKWVIAFTTPISVIAGTGHFQGAEYPVDGSQPCNRRATLSTTPCGPPLSPGASVQGFTVTNIFYLAGQNPNPGFYPTLALNTTYYLTVETDDTSTMFISFVAPNGH